MKFGAWVKSVRNAPQPPDRITIKEGDFIVCDIELAAIESAELREGMVLHAVVNGGEWRYRVSEGKEKPVEPSKAYIDGITRQSDGLLNRIDPTFATLNGTIDNQAKQIQALQADKNEWLNEKGKMLTEIARLENSNALATVAIADLERKTKRDEKILGLGAKAVSAWTQNAAIERRLQRIVSKLSADTVGKIIEEAGDDAALLVELLEKNAPEEQKALPADAALTVEGMVAS